MQYEFDIVRLKLDLLETKLRGMHEGPEVCEVGVQMDTYEPESAANAEEVSYEICKGMDDAYGENIVQGDGK